MPSVRIQYRGQLRVLEVSDTGLGIPGGHEPRLFDRLYRGAGGGERGGAGLGLAIAKWAVKANQGQLSYERQRGQGSTFWIELPV